MPNKPLVITFLGSIGVGKSYFARQLAAKSNVVRLNMDALRLAWYGSVEEVDAHQSEYSVINLRFFRVLDYIVKELLVTKTSVILDVAQFNVMRRRQELYDIASKQGATVILVWLKHHESSLLTA